MGYDPAMTVLKTQKPYLTPAEVAAELDCGVRNVHKLISDGKLPFLKRSERKTLVPAPALVAYVERLNGTRRPLAERRRDLTRDEVVARFVAGASGRTPEEFVRAWKRDEIEDTAENRTLLVQALSVQLDMADETAGLHVATF